MHHHHHHSRILAALSAALLVSPAAAQFQSPREVLRGARGGWDHPPIERGHDHGRGPRWDFSHGWRGEQVRQLAHQLEGQTHGMRERYRHERPGNFFKQLLWAAAYQSLQDLEASAARFHRSVESRWQDPEDTAEDYAALVATYNEAAQSVPNGYRFERIEGSWREAAATMHWLDQAYRHRRGGRRDGPGHGSSLERWAWEAESAARQAYDAAIRTPSRGGMWERDAIEELAELVAKASAVREMVRQRRSSFDLRWEVRRLESQVDDAERAVDWADGYRDVKDDLRRVAGAVAGLKAAAEAERP